LLQRDGVSLAPSRELYDLPCDDLAQRVSFDKLKLTTQVAKGGGHDLDVFWLERTVLQKPVERHRCSSVQLRSRPTDSHRLLSTIGRGNDHCSGPSALSRSAK
jgi:hypothetical protein